MGLNTSEVRYVPQTLTAAQKAQVGQNVGGTAANDVVALDASAKLPAVDGSQLTNLASGAGDMLKSTYDPQNAGKISGASPGGAGGSLNLDGGDGTSTGGTVQTNGGSGASGGNGGDVYTYGGNTSAGNGGGAGGDIDTRGGTGGAGGVGAAGGSINMAGGADGGAAGGSITTAAGGGSIDTTGAGSIQLGAAATRTTITGHASAPRALDLPNFDSTTVGIDTGWTAAAAVGDKTDSVEAYSGSGIDGTMAGALNVVSAGLGDALQQDEARIKELIHFCQALQTALVAKLIPNA